MYWGMGDASFRGPSQDAPNSPWEPKIFCRDITAWGASLIPPQYLGLGGIPFTMAISGKPPPPGEGRPQMAYPRVKRVSPPSKPQPKGWRAYQGLLEQLQGRGGWKMVSPRLETPLGPQSGEWD